MLWHCFNAGIVLSTMIIIYFIYSASTVINFCSHKGLDGIITKRQPSSTDILVSMLPMPTTFLKGIYFL